MLGLGLIGVSALLEEIADSIGKSKITRHELNVYALGFLLHLGGLLTILAFALFVPKDLFAPGFPGGLVFSTASLPTLGLRIVLEFLQVYVTVRAIASAERGTFGFLRTLTLPLLLVVDVILGYSISNWQVGGIVIIVLSLFILFLNHGLSREGSLLTLIGAINAVGTISLFKYNVTHFNSVEAEQGIVIFTSTVFLFVLAVRAGQNPLRLLARPIYVLEVILSGIASTLMSFAYLFAPASIITTGKRSFAVLWAILSGNTYFKEKHFFLKLTCFAFVCLGIIMLLL